MSRGQLPLDLGFRPAQGRADFIVAPCNEAAVAWIDRWPDWPAPGLVLAGPSGAGKSHLAAVWRARSAAADFAPVSPPDGPPALVVEGADRIAADRAGAEALFHAYNAVAARRGHVLLTAPAPAARWTVALPDLASRLRALPTAEIGLPDDALLSALYAKLFADRRLAVPEGLVPLLVARLERSAAAASAAVARLDRAALAERRAITLPFARRTLGLDG
jgi:chromosomal replication initiation ATPase DnaA